MLLGKTRPGAAPVELPMNTIRSAIFPLQAGRVAKLSAYLDGLGSATSPNVVPNGDFETNTSGWSGIGTPANISRDATVAKSGVASLKVVCPNGAPTVPGDGTYMSTAAPVAGSGTAYVVSAWVLAPAGTVLYLRVTDLVATEYTRVHFTATGAWQQVSATVSSTNTSMSAQVYCDAGQGPVTFWIDVVRIALLTPPPGPALLRPVIHDLSGNLVASGDEIQVVQGATGAWRDLTFSAVPGGVPVSTASYELGVQAGGTSLVARVWEDTPDSPGGVTANDLYSDGAASVMASPVTVAGRFAVTAVLFPAAALLPGQLEMWYGRLPWEQSQAVFRATAPVVLSAQNGAAGWYGSGLNQERGAFAVAKAGGKFDPLLGERIRVATLDGRSEVFLYVLDLEDMDYDLAMTRRAYLELGQLGTDQLSVVVERMT